MRDKKAASCLALGTICILLFSGLEAHARPLFAINICGMVSLPNGRPAARATVSISGRNGYNTSTVTNEQGGYCFEEVPATFYNFSVTPPQDEKYRADPVSLDAAHYGPTFTVNIFTKNPLEASLAKQRPAKVISAIEAAQQIPREAKKALSKAQKYRDRGRYDNALAELDKAAKIFPEYFQAFTEMGIVRIKTGHADDALKDFNKALQLCPEYAPALSGAGYCLLTLGKYEQSAEFLGRAVELDSGDSMTFLFLGIADLALGRWQKAQAALEDALNLDPRAASAHLYLGNALAAQHLYGKAAGEMHTYLKMNPGAPNAEQLHQKEVYWQSLEKKK